MTRVVLTLRVYPDESAAVFVSQVSPNGAIQSNRFLRVIDPLPPHNDRGSRVVFIHEELPEPRMEVKKKRAVDKKQKQAWRAEIKRRK